MKKLIISCLMVVCYCGIACADMKLGDITISSGPIVKSSYTFENPYYIVIGKQEIGLFVLTEFAENMWRVTVLDSNRVKVEMPDPTYGFGRKSKKP